MPINREFRVKLGYKNAEKLKENCYFRAVEKEQI